MGREELTGPSVTDSETLTHQMKLIKQNNKCKQSNKPTSFYTGPIALGISIELSGLASQTVL